MSKSKGNVVDPLEQMSLFGVEQVRYFLMKEGYLHHDGGKACHVFLSKQLTLTSLCVCQHDTSCFISYHFLSCD